MSKTYIVTVFMEISLRPLDFIYPKKSLSFLPRNRDMPKTCIVIVFMVIFLRLLDFIYSKKSLKFT